MSIKEECRNSFAKDDLDEVITYDGDNLEFNDGRSSQKRPQTLKSSSNLHGHSSSRSVRSETTSLLTANEKKFNLNLTESR